MKTRILITGGGGSGSEALYRIWKKKYKLYFCDSNFLKKPNILDKSCWIKIPIASSKNYIQELKKIIIKYKINLLIPAVDEELKVISNNRNKIKCEILLPNNKFINIHSNKWKTNQFLKRNNLKHPVTYILKKKSKLLKPPFVLKPMIGRGSKGLKIINIKQNAKKFISQSDKEGKMIMQRKIIGEEYTVMICANKYGIVRAIVPVKVIEKKGITTLGVTDKNKKVIDECYKIHNKMKTSGCYNIQLVLTENNEVYPFEINPRISTTTCLAIYCGVNIVEIFINDKVKIEKKNNLKSFKNNILLSRSWVNEFSNFK